MLPTIRVVAAIVFNTENQFLMARKKEGKSLAGYWEFPGGKVDAEEDDLSALKREIKEELNVDLKEVQFVFKFTYQYPEKEIELVFFKAQIAQGEIRLIDHDGMAWIDLLQVEKGLKP
ncbi:MAG: (deoxy)nucleoside triphosphate pyrophosphohydrolase [Bacteroidetes bacterium]|nr:(deoxy)nucleoside triphosphate pyrophosphohydrolase [Bacteroidota bacterium]